MNMSMLVSMRACCYKYEHVSHHARMLLYICLHRSPCVPVALHTSMQVSMRVCCPTYEHTSLHSILLHTST
ncbi:hypothetical protein Hanom_Chr00s000188g01627731 [Helianthus anomalus]